MEDTKSRPSTPSRCARVTGFCAIFGVVDGHAAKQEAVADEQSLVPKPGDQCEPTFDKLLLPDVETGKAIYYLQCIGYGGQGLPQGGFWQKIACQTGFRFMYTRQACVQQQVTMLTAPTFAPMAMTPSVQSAIEQMAAARKSVINADPGSSCKGGEFCEGGSFCNVITFVCTCPAGYSLSGKTCRIQAPKTTTSVAPSVFLGGRQRKELGEACDHETECTFGAFCTLVDSLYSCQCGAGFVSVGSRCKLIIRYNQYGCEHTLQCTSATPGALCVDRVCRCQSGATFTGVSCASAGQAMIAGAPTIRVTFAPPTTAHTYPTTHTYTRPPPPPTPPPTPAPTMPTQPQPQYLLPGSYCTEIDYCIGASSCRDGVCSCTEGYVLNHATSNCDHGGISFFTTTPMATTTTTPQKVSAAIPPGFACSPADVCLGNSFCFFGRCTCPPGMIERNSECVKAHNVKVESSQGFGSSQVTNYQPIPPSTNNGESESCPLPESPERCRLPNCFCSKSGREIPGGLSVNDAPQLVVLTFDDPVNGKTIDFYKKFFDGRYKNRNGCPIKATFFVSHEWTNYDDVQWLSSQGHEIASNSITHDTLTKEPMSRWIAEMADLRTIFEKFGKIDRSEIVGMRAPQLSVNGDITYEMMKNHGFLYDNSMPADPGPEGAPFWPQTLDHQTSWECQADSCPKVPHPGIWEFPLNMMHGYYIKEITSQKRGAMLRSVMDMNETEQSTLELLRRNFDRAYKTNKAPYVITLNADFLFGLDDRGAIKTLTTFVEELLQRPDVWFATMRDVVQWVQTPLSNSQMQQFPPLQCVGGGSGVRTRTPPACVSGNKCIYKTPEMISGDHMFKTCSACPRKYPWLDNPEGQRK